MYKYYIDKYFSKKFVNLNAITYNPIMLLIYRITYPLSMLLNYFKIKPNTISFISLLFCFFSLFFIINHNSFLFSFFWMMSILLDFCDGTVARLSNIKSNFRFNIDHYLDLFKISLVILFFSIDFNDKLIWLISFLFILLLFFNEIIISDLTNNITINLITELKPKNNIYIYIKSLYTILFTFNAHTLFIFVIMILKPTFARFILLYLVFLLLKNFLINLTKLLKNEK
jgi:phosphatidylglycerophosphate synthase